MTNMMVSKSGCRQQLGAVFVFQTFLLVFMLFLSKESLGVFAQDPLTKVAPFPHLDNVLNHDPTGNTQCFPAWVCQGIDITQIPYLFDHMNPAFVNPNDNNLFDTKKTQACLNNKRILVLGDSVLEELVLDIATLLSGVATVPQELDSFIHDSGAKSPHHFLHKLPNGVTVFHHSSRRNMTVIGDRSDTYMRHRFTGHFNIKENYYGMRTLNEPAFVNDELLCLLGLVGQEVECPVPDIIMLNGGHHDVHSGTGQCDNFCLDTFANALRKFLDFLNSQYTRAGVNYVKVYWKGTLLTARDIAYGIKNNRGALYLLDKAAQQVTHEYGIPYINASDVLQYVPRFQEQNRMYEIYTKDRIHHGGIARSHDANKVGTVSMLVTQRILAAICPTLINADPTLGMGSRMAPHIDPAKLAGNVPGMLGSLPAPKYDMNHGFGDQRQAGNNLNGGPGSGIPSNGGMNSGGLNSGGMNSGGGMNSAMMGGDMNTGGGNNPMMGNNMMGNRFNTMMNSGGRNNNNAMNGGYAMNNGGGGGGGGGPTPSGAKDFGTQRLEKVQAANAKISSNPNALKEDLSGGDVGDSSGESRFAATERQRCARGRCKKGYIEGTADDPNVNGGGGSKGINDGGQVSMGGNAFTATEQPNNSNNNMNMNGNTNTNANDNNNGAMNSMENSIAKTSMDMVLGPGVSMTPKSASSSLLGSTSRSDSASSSSSSSGGSKDEIPEWKKKQLAARAAFRAQNNLDSGTIESKRQAKKKSDAMSSMTGGGIGLRRNRNRRMLRHAE